ncbi:hypothetical protein DENIS_2600 [Desulfonema ishimotonii]|uniref:Uncharacterized protein n=1 Tax=Desulfonema ishimotonii TaxID=45657 RepID=A0A401FXC5_9BACT|nr:hypothetical protein [Desulfonema ishimotonii]GBC61638.1 hypothetical protein DENIS_2600 [Desulfonema ishimotonii]
MSETPKKVENLKKITLMVEAGKTAEMMNLTPQPVSYAFIFGIGKEGLTPFEYELVDKAVGDTVAISVLHEETGTFFEHIALPLTGDMPERLHVRATIDQVETPEGREVIQAMASLSGDCGCGCGGHGPGTTGCGGGSCESHGQGGCGC